MTTPKRPASAPRALATLGLACGLMAIVPAPALACGGFFCMRQPMDQAAERILFVQDGGTVHAHVQIQYTGEAPKFSWVVPFPTEPKLTVGSDVLFTQLDQATAPQWRLSIQKTLGDCPPPPMPAPAGAMLQRERKKDGVEVVSRELVGPYDTAVIRSNDPAALKKWLTKNGYVLPPKLDPMLDPYVAGKYYFVALKLQQDRGTGDLQPIAVSYRATKPGIPIRLTAVAATPDMGVYAWVLGDERAVPENYRHVVVNETKIDWINGGQNYRNVVTRAANEAGGQAFTTDYAGRASVVDVSPFLGQKHDLDKLARLTDPVRFLRAIQDDGYFLPGSQNALAFVRRYVPIPKTMKDVWEPGFYSNPEQYREQLEKAGVKVDARRAANELRETVVKPYQAIRRQFANHDYLTRMYTTMSPEEMTQDPTFRFNPAMGQVSNIHEATGVRDCRKVKNFWLAPVHVTLKNGTTFTIDPVERGSGLDDGMPAALRVEQTRAEGRPQVIHDNSARISRELSRRKAAAAAPAPADGPRWPLGGGEGALVGLALIGLWGLRRR